MPSKLALRRDSMYLTTFEGSTIVWPATTAGIMHSNETKINSVDDNHSRKWGI